jgi:hypothetical protein
MACTARWRKKIRNALTQGVCTYRGEWGFSVTGEQGEQIYQTNYGQMGKAGSQQLFWRGGMHVWNRPGSRPRSCSTRCGFRPRNC